MNCPECGHEVPDGGAFCGDCGARVEARRAAVEKPPKPDAQAMLSRANLLRVRGQWEAAAEQCAEVLKIDAQNVAVHSLLGEIYDNQGHLERAIRWYEEALELNPNSVADRAKLARARELHRAREQRKTAPARPGFSWLRVAGAAGATICGGILLLAVFYARPTPSDPNGPVMATPAPTPVHRASPVGWLSTQEREVGEGVAPILAGGLQLGTVDLDPQEKTVRLGLSLDLAAYTLHRAVPVAQKQLMLEGYRAARRVLEIYPEARRVDLRVAVPVPVASGPPEYEYWFRGSLPTEALTVAPENVAAADLDIIYRKPWWNMKIAP